ncbi:MAG: hypothetical protein JWP04_1564 [Belnapia sp.]|nr:hypothetical protein [Belnapia sp.]
MATGPSSLNGFASSGMAGYRRRSSRSLAVAGAESEGHRERSAGLPASRTGRRSSCRAPPHPARHCRRRSQALWFAGRPKRGWRHGGRSPARSPTHTLEASATTTVALRRLCLKARLLSWTHCEWHASGYRLVLASLGGLQLCRRRDREAAEAAERSNVVSMPPAGAGLPCMRQPAPGTQGTGAASRGLAAPDRQERHSSDQPPYP